MHLCFGKYTFGPDQFKEVLPISEIENNLGALSSTFHVEQPETLIEWKFKSITDGGGYLWIDGGGYMWTDRHG